MLNDNNSISFKQVDHLWELYVGNTLLGKFYNRFEMELAYHRYVTGKARVSRVNGVLKMKYE